MTIEFEKYGKTPRLYGAKCVVTEKLHGTNGTLRFDEAGNMTVGSRNRQLTDDTDDNFGFYEWAKPLQQELFFMLGEGVHAGEWVGPGIEGNRYELDSNLFALFNAPRHIDKFRHYAAQVEELQLTTVPLLDDSVFQPYTIPNCMEDLRNEGSYFSAVPFSEGVCIWLGSVKQVFKVTHASEGFKYSEGKWRDDV